MKKNNQPLNEKQKKPFDRPVLLIMAALILVTAFLIFEALNNHSRTKEQFKNVFENIHKVR